MPSRLTAFNLILLKINFGSNTTIRVWDYKDIATNSPLSSPNLSIATITAPVAKHKNFVLRYLHVQQRLIQM
jgi:hypothetical protein